jgi:hypothetical protein
MEIVHTHCSGLDVHKKTVAAAIIVPDAKGGLHKETRTFGTMTLDLLALSDWLMAQGVSHVAMESTGEYWKPVFNILENNFEVLLVNAQHIKAVPGRKTDIQDAEWIAELLRHGLLRAVCRLGNELRDSPLSSTFVKARPGQSAAEGAQSAIKLAVWLDVPAFLGEPSCRLCWKEIYARGMAELAKGGCGRNANCWRKRCKVRSSLIIASC